MTRRKVMISSTARDLPEHRDEIRLGCERAGFEPLVMEHLPALDADAIKASLRLVDEADVYVGVFAYRYGHVPDGFDISITEMEYDRAVQLQRPRLIFFIHEDHPITRKDIESGAGESKLLKLKDRLGKERVITFFRSPQELRAQVVEALSALGRELDTTAASGDAVASTAAKLHRRTSIPTPPEPYIAHPYTLLQSRELVGRQAELNALTNWIANPRSEAFDARIFCFVAIGGMGKSALTWKWFNQIAPNEMKPLAGRMWWSFYESDATFENFLNRALCYVSGQSDEEVRALSWQEREAQLLQHLNAKPYIFALDGLERVLISYNRMDVSNLVDDEYDKRTANWVTGAAGLPATAAQSFVGEHRMRKTMDTRAGALLRRLAQVTKSRILISSRLYPSDLQLPTLNPRPGCFAMFLKGLADDDVLGLWRGLGISGSRAELLPIFRSIENHPLLIQALASEVAKYREAPCDFARWRADHPQFDPTSLPLVQSRTHILQFALSGLSEQVREVLSMVVGFRMPASYASLEALLVGEAKTCSSARDLDLVLSELEDRGLIGWDRQANRYDAHPIVRGVVWQLTNEKDRRAVLTALEAHFEPMAVPDQDKVESLADLFPAVERYHTLIDLGRFDDALGLFVNRLSAATLYRLAAHRERIAWLERLFPDGVGGTPVLSSEGAQAAALNRLANSYMLSGQPGRATELHRRVAEIDRQKIQRQSDLIILSYSLFDMGSIREAVGIAREALILNRDSDDKPNEGITLTQLGLMSSACGDFVSGRIALIRVLSNTAMELSWGLALANLSECSLWAGNLAAADSSAKLALEAAIKQRNLRNLTRAALLQGSIALNSDEIERADERLRYALTRARAVNLMGLELPTSIAIAELELSRGHIEDAKAQLIDVWEAAERGPYPMHQADAYIVTAEIALAEGNQSAAIDAATEAYKAAWCDGPPYAYHWGLEKAKAHLAALGAPEPDMPPFDESKFEPLPEVEINPKDEFWVDPDKLD